MGLDHWKADLWNGGGSHMQDGTTVKLGESRGMFRRFDGCGVGVFFCAKPQRTQPQKVVFDTCPGGH